MKAVLTVELLLKFLIIRGVLSNMPECLYTNAVRLREKRFSQWCCHFFLVASGSKAIFKD